ncbi:IS21 family transposase [Effusibacillus dendaii]|uniref:IS21 family transposase n=1 Tax=Effusibacillus dendaii TaxID=2743772 RepID=A0A7I8DEH5_9BACL|nr:IS21 family transposase [Effusibacillus dendaii]BCJ88608.1 IS21 family transposase [Effusibacillus dendaii]
MYYREGKSQREIARLTGVDRKTIGKYIEQYEKQRRELEQSGNPEDAGVLIRAIVEAPKYTVGHRPARKLTEEIEKEIQRHLDENEEKRRRGQHKQVKKMIDIYEALVAENMDISYSSVKRFIRLKVEKPQEAFIKERYLPGNVCEFDWGEVKLTVNGKLQTFQMAVFTPAYSNYRYAYLFTKQTTECFQEAHALFFQEVGGVFQTMVYDNMKVAVKRFVGTEKQPTDGLLQLSIYYGFRFRFCNIHSGNEKGHVERSVEVVRRKAFAFRDTFDTLGDANRYVHEVCIRLNGKPQDTRDGCTAAECFEQERPSLLALPPMFDAARTVHARVDKYATVVVDQNHYSVPDHLVGKLVLVKIYSNRIQCFYQDYKVAEHIRLTGNHEWRLELDHYLNTLKKKPGAFAGSAALQQAPQKIKTMYEKHYTRREKEFVELLQFMQTSASLAEVEHAIDELCHIHPSHVTTDKIKVLCARSRETAPPAATLSQTAQEIAERAKAHLRAYDDLFQTHISAPEEAIA